MVAVVTLRLQGKSEHRAVSRRGARARSQLITCRQLWADPRRKQWTGLPSLGPPSPRSIVEACDISWDQHARSPTGNPMRQG